MAREQVRRSRTAKRTATGLRDAERCGTMARHAISWRLFCRRCDRASRVAALQLECRRIRPLSREVVEVALGGDLSPAVGGRCSIRLWPPRCRGALRGGGTAGGGRVHRWPWWLPKGEIGKVGERCAGPRAGISDSKLTFESRGEGRFERPYAAEWSVLLEEVSWRRNSMSSSSVGAPAGMPPRSMAPPPGCRSG